MANYDRPQIIAGISNMHDVLSVLDSEQELDKEARQWLIDTLSAGYDQIREGLELTPEEEHKIYQE